MKFYRPKFAAISTRDWCALLRFYRIVRIRIPLAPGVYWPGALHSGLSYGMTRDEARTWLTEVATQIDFHEYVASK